jgi:hypothetical protein
MLPVLGGEVEEREQRGGVLLQGRDGLRVLGAVLGGELLHCFACLRTGLGVHYLVERGLYAGLQPLRELVEDVAELVEPVPLRGERKLVDVCREHDLKQSEVEGWMDTFLKAGERGLKECLWHHRFTNPHEAFLVIATWLERYHTTRRTRRSVISPRGSSRRH